MAQHFFTGGLMPSADLFSRFDDDLQVSNQWRINGKHYTLTCEAWLKRLDSQTNELLELFSADLAPAQATIQLQRWRMFFMACAELFQFHDGDEWFVSHYLFDKRGQDDKKTSDNNFNTKPRTPK